MPHVECSVGLRLRVPLAVDTLQSQSTQKFLEKRLGEVTPTQRLNRDSSPSSFLTPIVRQALVDFLSSASGTMAIQLQDIRCRCIPAINEDESNFAEFDMFEYSGNALCDYSMSSKAMLRALDFKKRLMVRKCQQWPACLLSLHTLKTSLLQIENGMFLAPRLALYIDELAILGAQVYQASTIGRVVCMFDHAFF